MPSEEQAVRLAAEKRKIPVGYLLQILHLTKTGNLSQAKLTDHVMTIIRQEADGRGIYEDPKS